MYAWHVRVVPYMYARSAGVGDTYKQTLLVDSHVVHLLWRCVLLLRPLWVARLSAALQLCSSAYLSAHPSAHMMYPHAKWHQASLHRLCGKMGETKVGDGRSGRTASCSGDTRGGPYHHTQPHAHKTHGVQDGVHWPFSPWDLDKGEWVWVRRGCVGAWAGVRMDARCGWMMRDGMGGAI